MISNERKNELFEMLTELKHQLQDHEIDYDYYIMATSDIYDLLDEIPEEDKHEIVQDQDDPFADCEMF